MKSLILSLFLLSGCSSVQATNQMKPLETVASVDLARYLGRWYEVASFPAWFQNDCECTTAKYSLRTDNDIDVLNRCIDKKSGEERIATARAWVTDKETNAKLKVRFFWPFTGKYWIIDLGPNYEYAVVGEPTRKYLWILSRTPQLEARDLKKIEERLLSQGYDLQRLQFNRQTNCNY